MNRGIFWKIMTAIVIYKLLYIRAQFARVQRFLLFFFANSRSTDMMSTAQDPTANLFNYIYEHFFPQHNLWTNLSYLTHMVCAYLFSSHHKSYANTSYAFEIFCILLEANWSSQPIQLAFTAWPVLLRMDERQMRYQKLLHTSNSILFSWYIFCYRW